MRPGDKTSPEGSNDVKGNGNLKHSSRTGKHRIKLRQSYLGGKVKARLCGRATTQLSDFCDPFPSAVDVNKDVYSSRRAFPATFPSYIASPLLFYSVLVRISHLFRSLRVVGTCIDTSFESRDRARVANRFAPFTASSVNHDRRFFGSSIRWKTKDCPPNWLRKPDRMHHGIK